MLKEVAEAFVDDNKFPEYVREKSALAISRFLVSVKTTLERDMCHKFDV